MQVDKYLWRESLDGQHLLDQLESSLQCLRLVQSQHELSHLATVAYWNVRHELDATRNHDVAVPGCQHANA